MMLKYEALTRQVIGAYYAVYNQLGHGFLEKVYENALVLELTERGFEVDQQPRIQVHFKGIPVGDYFADLIVNDVIILEVKAADAIHEAHKVQLTNYLRATTCEIGFVLNFGPKAEFERRYFSNAKKRSISQKSA